MTMEESREILGQIENKMEMVSVAKAESRGKIDIGPNGSQTKHLTSKLRPPQHNSMALNKKYLPVTSSGYGKISIPRSSSSDSIVTGARKALSSTDNSRSSSVSRALPVTRTSAIVSLTSVPKSSLASSTRAPSAIRTSSTKRATSASRASSASRSSSASRASSTSRALSIKRDNDDMIAPSSLRSLSASRAVSTSYERKISSAPSSIEKQQIRSNGTVGGSIWKLEQREIQRRRKEQKQQQQLSLQSNRLHKRKSLKKNEIPLSYAEALESPIKAMKVSNESSPKSQHFKTFLDKSTKELDSDDGLKENETKLSSFSSPFTLIQSMKSISPKNSRNKVKRDLMQNNKSNLSPVDKRSRSVEKDEKNTEYFDRRKLILSAELNNEKVLDSSKSEIQAFANIIFAQGTGLETNEIKKLINTKIGPTKQWDYRKKIDASTNLIKRLRDTLNCFLQAKNKLLATSIQHEERAISLRNKSIQKLRILEEEMIMYKKRAKRIEAEIVLLNEQVKDKDREISRGDEKNCAYEKELEAMKIKLEDTERARAQVEITLAVTEDRCKEATKNADSWRHEIVNIEASKSEAVKKAQESLERELNELREECAMLRIRMASRDEELGRLVNLKDDSDNTSDSSKIVNVKRELDRLRERTTELESNLSHKESELCRAKYEIESLTSRLDAKDADMKDLMRGLGDMQKTAVEREEKANMLRMTAEDKAAELEVLLTEARGENSVLLHEKSTLRCNAEKFHESIGSMENTISLLKAELQESKVQFNSKDTNLQVEIELRARAEAKEKEERNERIALSAQMVAMTKEHARVEAQLKEINDSQERQFHEKISIQKHLCDEHEKEIAAMKESIASFEGERCSLMNALNDKKTMADAKKLEEIGRLNGEINVLNNRLKDADIRATSFGETSAEEIRKLQKQLREGQAERRKLHNTIQELRGNVRVFARVRPFLPDDGESSEAEPCIIPQNENSLKICNQDDPTQDHNFTFDRVFSPSSGQDAVFEEVSEFVQSALDGYNVCLFSYGQTGSGKTHTMQGSGVGQMRGIIPRAIEQVGHYKKSLESEGWSYDMKVSFLEIYNETIRDLLRTKDVDTCKHDIKLGNDGQRYVTDLTIKMLDPEDSESVKELMRQAAKHRSVASTDMNATSSRSHSVFTLYLTARHSKQRQTLRGMLNLVDLAGSERLDRSGATGDRAKEAMSINKSLSSLSDVFTSIGRKANHIPFRNSKLTYLLQPSLSGDGKTLMMVNLSPTERSYNESLCALRFATQVNKCELGKPRRSIEEIDSDNEKPKRHRIAVSKSPHKKLPKRQV